jgi:DHA1 family tetracycline resistance protein-like MFS transporter
MPTDPPPAEPARPTTPPATRAGLRPLLAAGFVTAFGAHAIAATLGRYASGRHASLVELGVLLELYDGAEVLLKPAFGALADRIGPRPVLLGGLVAFAAASAAFVAAGAPDALAATRLAQGAAAAAFSPAASTLVARLSPDRQQGRWFGSYGAWKGLGYTLGPLLGGALVTLGGFRLLFATLAGLALAVAGWATVAVPASPPLPKARETLLALARRLAQPAFVQPTVALAAATAALSVGVGFLPVRGAAAGLGPLATGAAVSLLAASAALIQPRAGRAYDSGRLPGPLGVGAGRRRVHPRRSGRRAGRLGPGRGGHRRRYRHRHPPGLCRPGRRRPARPSRSDHGRRRGRPRVG